MKTKLLAITGALLFGAFQQKAQVSAYTFTQSLSSYGAIGSGTMVGALMQDEDVNSVNLPFPFVFNGTTYTTINVCANGYLSFNALSGFEYTAISDNSTQEVIAPFGNDLVMGILISGDLTTGSNTITNCSSVAGFSVGDMIFDYNSDFGSNPVITSISGNNIVLNTNALSTTPAYDVISMNGYLNQNVIGTAPNRICEFEFHNMSRFFVYDEVVNFKVRLHETSNIVEFVYGTMIPGSNSFASEVGLKGTTNTDFNSRQVTSPGNWNASNASTAITDVCDFDSSTFPVNGQSYKWTPITCLTPTLSIVSTKSVSCAGESVTLTVSGATSYTWANGSNATQLVLSSSNTATYSVLGANLTCTSSLTFTQVVVSNPTITILQSNTLICSGQSATLTASGASTYSWSNGTPAAQNIVTPTANAVYTVSAGNGTCEASASATVNVQNCTGLSSVSTSQDELTAYPNPFNSSLTFKNNGTIAAQLTVLDAVGKVVYSTTLKADDTTTISAENLNKGFYFVRLNRGSETITKKLIKE